MRLGSVQNLVDEAGQRTDFGEDLAHWGTSCKSGPLGHIVLRLNSGQNMVGVVAGLEFGRDLLTVLGRTCCSLDW